jgi:hypothetical protein
MDLIMYKHLKLVITSLMFTLLTSLSAFAQEETPKPVKLFKSHEMMHVTLKGPWRSIVRRKTNPETHAGAFEYTDSAGNRQSLEIGLTTRGLTRLERVCDFPPLKVWFDKEQVKGTEFRGQKSLKMVTHCKSSIAYQKYYVQEYLSYRIYNLITPFSFRVRPLMITYVDTERDSQPVERFGFLIEDVDDVADRNGLKELEIPKVSYKKLDPVETANYSVFQYMISNLDWSATSGRDPEECCHNSKLMSESPGSTPVYVVPYDLDSSGLVNAPYAAPPDQLKVRSVTQRLYRGFCFHNNEIPATLTRYQENKQEILALFNNEELLTGKARISAVKYLEGFYKSVETPEKVRKNLTDKCRG